RIPDLFAGQPLQIHGRYRRPGKGVVRIEGTRLGRPVTLRHLVALPEQAADHEALGRLWARARIHRLSRELHDGTEPAAIEQITALGLRHRLMTQWTSLVAVDSEISNMTGSSVGVSVPVEMPEDVSYEDVFGNAAPLYAGVGVVGKRQATGGVVGGVVGGVLGGVTGGLLSQEASRPVSKAEARLMEFERLLLIDADGGELVVEEDGEVWKIGVRQRTLVRSLTASELGALKQALALANPGTWSGIEQGRRLVFESRSQRRVITLPSGDPDVEALVGWIERLGR
ncbi:MAG: hypothetical protein ACRDHY_04505, partial [Anaerolineales bacterium]